MGENRSGFAVKPGKKLRVLHSGPIYGELVKMSKRDG
jgi:hypothetical protein